MRLGIGHAWGLVVLWFSTSAHATTSTTIPEPGTWSLVALAGVAALIVKVRNRRK